MRKELLNHRPTSALRGQSPLCESVGTGHTSTHPSIFTKVLLVLLTTLLLPSAAWGQAITRTFKFDQTANQSEAFTTSQLAVSITETVGENTPTNSTGVVTITNPAYMGNVNHSVSSYSSSENGAVFTLTTDAVTEGHNGVGFFTIEIPGNYPKEPTQVALKIAYANSSVGTDNLTARISIGDYADNDYTSTATSLDETTLTLTATGGQTKRNSEGSLKIRVYLNGQSVATTTFTIKEVTITYTPDSYGLTIGGTEVTTENKDDVFNDGKVRFVPSYTIETITIPHTLTLNGATISGDGISWTNTDANNSLNIALVGANAVTKISGPGSPAPDLSIVSNGESASSLTIGSETATENAIQGFTYASNPYTPPYYNGDTHMYWIPTKSGDITTKLVVSSVVADMFDGGDGGDSPFQISRAEQLLFVSYATNKNFILSSKTINCESLTSFEPIGSYSNPFIGKFDGNNCTIKNLTYSTNGTGDRVGLFGYVDNNAKIEKLTLSDCSFIGGEYVGGIVGELKDGTIENCVLSSCTVKSGNAQIPYAGGIAGQVFKGTINKCTFNSGLVDCTTAYSGEPSGGVYAGGIVGNIYSTNSVTVSSCIVSSTNVKSVHSGSYGAYDIYVGGIVGCSLGTSTIAISGNKVTNTDNNPDDPKKISCKNLSEMATNYHCGAIIGEKGDETTLTNNTYEYDVTTEIAGTTKSGYTERGIGGTYPDVTENNGAVMYTKTLTLTGGVSYEGVDFYEPLSDDDVLALAPGQTVVIDLYPADGKAIYAASLVYTPTGGEEKTDALTNIGADGQYKYSFEMPNANTTLNVTYNEYDLWIGETQVTVANKDHILGEGNTSVTFAVTGNEASGYVNTLTLDNANFTGSIQWKNSENLIVNLVGSNEITIANADYVFVRNATGDAPTLTLTTDKSAPGTLKVNGLASKNSIASGWSSSSSKFIYSSDDYPADGDWWVQAYETDDYMDITLNKKYDLWINGTQYCDANLDPIAGAKFVPESSTLEYGYTGEYSFTSSLRALKVKIKTASASMASINFAATVAVPSGTLTFQAEDSSCKLTLSDSFAGFNDNDVIYEDNLVLRTIVGVDTGNSSYSVETISKPTMAGDGSNVTFNFNADLELHYSIDYMKEGVDGVTGTATSGTPVALSGPCTVTAYTKWNDSQSDNVVGTLFGFADAEPTATYQLGGTVNSPSILPSLPESAKVTYADSGDKQTNNINSGTGVISINGVATESYTATTVFSDGGYEDENGKWVEVLNSGNNGTYNLGTFSLTVTPKSLTNDMIQAIEDQTYTGTALTPAIEVKDGETTLTQAEDVDSEGDFTVAFSNNTNAALSTAETAPTVTITGKGNYSGTATKTFTIAAKDASAATIILKENMTYTYNGSDQTPAVVSVELDGGTIPDTNYDISYSNNKNAGLATAGENAPTVIVTFKNNYSGEATTTFTIEQADLSDYVVTDLTTPTAYTGSPITPTFSVKATADAETSLTANTDYSVKYQQADADVDEMKNVGDYKILITGEGNYKGSKSVDFTIERAKLALTINLDDLKGWTYLDTPKEPMLEGNLGGGAITWEYKDKAAGAEAYSAWSTLTKTTDAGTYMVKATVAETDNYEGGSTEAEFVIAQYDLANATVILDPEELVYNGEEQTVTVTVKAGDIEVPVDCYEVSGNTTGKEAGDYKLTVTAKTMDSSGNPIKNNFTGSAEKDWKIKNRTVTTDELGLSENQSQATYYSETEDLEVPEGVVAYIITGVNGNNVVTQRIRYIKKGVAVFVEQTTSTENPLEVIPDASELPLKGTAVDLNVASISGGTVYVLYKGEFVKSTTGTIPAKRCYLLLPNNVAAGTRAFGIIGGGSDGSTAIKSINDEPSTIDNWYDMGGHRIEKPTKTGIYIKNGKKVAIK